MVTGPDDPTLELSTAFHPTPRIDIPTHIQSLIDSYLELGGQPDDDYVALLRSGDLDGAIESTKKKMIEAETELWGAQEAERRLALRILRLEYVKDAMMRANDRYHNVDQHGTVFDGFHGDGQAFADMNGWPQPRDEKRLDFGGLIDQVP